MNTPPKSYLHKFKKLLNYVLRSNEFYRKKFKAAGVTNTNQINTWDDFYNLPFTTRDELIKDQHKRPPFGSNLTRPISEYSFVIRTSGTLTGKPFQQPLTPEEFNRFADVMARGYREMGVKKGDVICYFTSSYAYPLVYETSRLLGTRMVPIEDYKSIDFFEKIKYLKINTLHSFPTAIFELIELAQERHIDLKRLGVRKIFTIGEVGGGHPPTKAYFEKMSGAKVIDHIGALESGTFATECTNPNTYHILENLFITEVFEPSSNRPAKKGELVLTSLWRRDYPLIRYRTGDMIEIDNSTCPCGKISPRLKGGILGRTTGQVKLRSYFIFPEEIERTIRQYHEVKEYQIICNKDNGVDNVDIYLEISVTTNKDCFNMLTAQLQETIGFQPKIYPLLPKTLPRFGSRKGKRFHDFRITQGQTPFKISPYRKAIALLLIFVFNWNNRLNNFRKYISVTENITR